MKKSYQKRLVLFVLLFSLVFPVTAQDKKEQVFDLKRDVLVTRLKNVLLSNDINTIKRNLIDRRFSPLHAMAAYRELLLWSKKAAENDPYWEDIVALVREGMVATIRDSNMGLPLKDWTGKGTPISVVYLNSFPAYKQIPDFNDLSTLKWRDDLFEEVVTPGSIGLSLTAKSLMITADQSQAGKENAPLMLASALQEMEILTQQLFLKKRWVLESENREPTGGEKKIQGKESKRGVKMLLAPLPKALGASSEKVLKNALGSISDESYVPNQLKLPVEEKSWDVKDDVSRLSSQASLLEGLLYLHELLANDVLMKTLMLDGSLEGRKLDDWRKLARHAIDVVYKTIMTKHFDAVTGSFVSSYRPGKEPDKRIRVDDANRAVNVLEKLSALFSKDVSLQKQVRKYMLSQAAFFEKIQQKKRGIPRGYILKNGAHITGLMGEFTNALSYVSIMLAAEKITGEGHYLDVAEKQFNSMHKVFWSEEAKIYRLSAGLKVSTYTGASIAIVMEWLRRMDAMLPAVIDAKEHVKNHIEVVLKHSGLLQSEGPATGEVNAPGYYLENEMDELYLRLKKGGVEKLAASIEKFVDHVSDQDGDGILGTYFSGNKTGGAPVITMQVGVVTPIFSGAGADRAGSLQRNYGF